MDLNNLCVRNNILSDWWLQPSEHGVESLKVCLNE
jgi:hypothetical protein